MSVSFTQLAQPTSHLSVLCTITFASCLAFMPTGVCADPLSFTSGNSQVQIIEGKPRRLTIQTVAPSQEDIKILGRTHFNEKCHRDAATNYDLTTPPLHGKVCFREETLAIKFSLQPAKTSCLGSYVPSSVVYYRPATTYIGTDAFQYAVVDARHNPLSIADVTITVTRPLAPSSDPLSEERADAAAEKQQLPGPMQRCPNPIM
jgi:hypothetical protein